MNICCHCHDTLAGLYVSRKRHIIRITVYVARTNRERKFQGVNVPESEYSWPFRSRSRERKGHGVKVPGSELARVLLADCSEERIGPGARRLWIKCCILQHPQVVKSCDSVMSLSSDSSSDSDVDHAELEKIQEAVCGTFLTLCFLYTFKVKTMISVYLQLFQAE